MPHDRGLVAHSDGDVVIHALCDALLGAPALGDIGHHFRRPIRAGKDVNSRHLLLECTAFAIERGYALSNADITVVRAAEARAARRGEPRLNPPPISAAPSATSA